MQTIAQALAPLDMYLAADLLAERISAAAALYTLAAPAHLVVDLTAAHTLAVAASQLVAYLAAAHPVAAASSAGITAGYLAAAAPMSAGSVRPAAGYAVAAASLADHSSHSPNLTCNAWA